MGKAKSYDKKIFRLVFILNKIETNRSVRSSDLAKEFNVTIRSIQRDIETLILTGFPLISSEKGNYSFAEGFSLRKALLTGEQASLLAFLNEIAAELGPKFKESFRGILAKVLYQETESAYYAKIPCGKGLDVKSREVKLLEKAIQEEMRVTFAYSVQGKNKAYKADPLKIAFFDGFWYLVCRVSDHDWILKLRVEKITDVNILDEGFETPANLKTMLDQSVNAWFSEGRKTKVLLKVAAAVAPYFQSREYVPLQRIIKTNKDGSILVESRVARFMEVTPSIFRWLPHIQVIHPDMLKDQVRKTLSSYLGKTKIKGSI